MTFDVSWELHIKYLFRHSKLMSLHHFLFTLLPSLSLPSIIPPPTIFFTPSFHPYLFLPLFIHHLFHSLLPFFFLSFYPSLSLPSFVHSPPLSFTTSCLPSILPSFPISYFHCSLTASFIHSFLPSFLSSSHPSFLPYHFLPLFIHHLFHSFMSAFHPTVLWLPCAVDGTLTSNNQLAVLPSRYSFFV